jgi:hypothetical protein
LAANYHTAGDRSYANDVKYRKFRRQLFHSSLSRILETLKPGMTVPEVMRCPDNHFRRAIYSLATYIADYPEQALLACIVQGWCPRYVYIFPSRHDIAYTFCRCTADKNDLDGGGCRRCREHTELLVSEFELGTLWDEYGLVGDIVVRLNLILIFPN